MKVAILCSQTIYRIGLEVMLRREFDGIELHISDSLSELTRLARPRPDLVMISLSARHSPKDFLGKIEAVARAFPKAGLIVIEEEYHGLVRAILPRVFEKGALGFLTRDYDPATVVECVKTVLRKKEFLPDELLKSFFDNSVEEAKDTTNRPNKKRRRGLTETEIEVARMLSEGESVSVIAAKTGRQVSTVSTIKRNILKKTNTQNTVMLYQLLLTGRSQRTA